MMALEIETVCRVTLAVIFVGAATIGIPHRLRADRAGGSVSRRADPAWFWIGMSVAGPPLALTCLAFLLQPRWIDFSAMDFAAGLRWTGVPLSLLGLGLFGWMFHHLGLNVTSTSMPRRSASLVTSGPYRWIRHPMYSAALILIAAASLLTANVVVVICGVIMFALLAARSRLEEQRLVEKFGQPYRDYQQVTGAFVPRAIKRR